MSQNSECQSQFQLEEFATSFKSIKYYYQVLRMKGSVYVWVGTESGEQGCLVTAITPRFQTTGGINPVSMLLAGPTQDMNTNCASRLEAKLKFPILISLNIPEDLQVLEHVEKTVLEKLS